MKKRVQKIIRAYGKMDIAFNNAGIVDHTIHLMGICVAGIVKLIAPKANSVLYEI